MGAYARKFARNARFWAAAFSASFKEKIWGYLAQEKRLKKCKIQALLPVEWINFGQNLVA